MMLQRLPDVSGLPQMNMPRRMNSSQSGGLSEVKEAFAARSFFIDATEVYPGGSRNSKGMRRNLLYIASMCGLASRRADSSVSET